MDGFKLARVMDERYPGGGQFLPNPAGLSHGHRHAKPDALSKPTLSFPADFIANGAQFVHGGTTINGRAVEAWPMSPKDDSERY